MNSYIKQETPIYAFIEPTTKCNAQCQMCERTFIDRKIGDMNMEKFIYTVEQLPNVKEVALQGLGEPLLNPDFFDMVRYLKEKNRRVSFNTNGSLLNDRNIKEIFDLSVDELRISYDAVTKKIFETIRRGLKFEKITENIIKTAKYKKELRNTHTKLTLTIVGMKINYHEIPMIVDFAVKNSFNKIELLNLYIMNKGIATFDNSLLSLGIEKVEKMINLISKKCKKNNIEFLSPLLEPYEAYRHILNCKWPFGGVNITWDGYVTPCCVISNPAVLNFGNIFEISIDKIWKSPKYEDFRRSFINKIIPLECKACLESRHILKNFLEVNKND